MSLYQTFKTDPNLEQNGVVINYGPNSKGIDQEFWVRRAGGANKQFQKSMSAKMRPYRKQLATGTMPDALAERIVREVYAETVVLKFAGIEVPTGEQDSEGNPVFQDLPYSVENCMRLFNDLPDLFTDIRDQCNEMAIFREDLEEAAKN